MTDVDCISISVWPNPYLSASVVREFHPNEASSEDKHSPIEKLIIFSLRNYFSSFALLLNRALLRCDVVYHLTVKHTQ